MHFSISHYLGCSEQLEVTALEVPFLYPQIRDCLPLNLSADSSSTEILQSDGQSCRSNQITAMCFCAGYVKK